MMQIFTIYNDEEHILDMIAKGQKNGLEWVYKHCFVTTKKMVIKLGGDEDEAWDVFQEAVTILYSKCTTPPGINLNCRINTYITAIARNLWTKRFNAKLLQTQPEEWDEVVDSGPADIQDFLQKEIDLQKLETALDELGSPCNTLLKAFYFEKKSMQDISEMFGYTNTDNAKTQKYKCLNRLKKIFVNLSQENN
jgi:RNA polymerase sigma factor (sigma-70 family)